MSTIVRSGRITEESLSFVGEGNSHRYFQHRETEDSRQCVFNVNSDDLMRPPEHGILNRVMGSIPISQVTGLSLYPASRTRLPTKNSEGSKASRRSPMKGQLE